eukprot:CAMPEP_0184312208 /NCGR_PEP_ID=MMETSP1049-20130417/47915_1 /TAXON_ID=77928 /ORGANISM="Proteomonas sulcata, Strain CCMP704" /LENGTH=152 /DNA_ID=CAMNT_0026628169 /DNA_START=579 /DNA_END=1038 /DNA_ORIENTATION=+
MSATDVTKTTSSFMSEVMQKRATECSCKNRNVATRGSTLRHYPVVTKASQPPALSPDFGPRPSSGSLTPLGSPTTEHGMDSAMMKQNAFSAAPLRVRTSLLVCGDLLSLHSSGTLRQALQWQRCECRSMFSVFFDVNVGPGACCALWVFHTV